MSILIYSNRQYVFGVHRVENNLNRPWIYILCYTLAFMVPLSDYSIALPISYVIFYLHTINKYASVDISRTCLKYYIAFLCWCTLSIIWATVSYYSIMMIAKLMIPLIFFSLSYKAFTNYKSVWIFFDIIAKSSIGYLFVSILAKIWFNQIFLYNPYYGLYASICSCAMFFYKKDNKYLLYTLLCFSYNIAYVKKTPILAIAAVSIVFFIFKYRMRAVIPSIFTALILFCVVLYVPMVRDRVFFEDFDPSILGTVSLDDFVLLLNTNGRSNMWEIVIDKFYKGNELIGAGLGTMKYYLRTDSEIGENFLLLHNDWLHILCETGKIGVLLLLSTFFSIIRFSYKCYSSSMTKDLKILSIACAGITVAVSIHMLFENCIGYFGYCFPFIFTSILYRYRGFTNK